MARCFALLLALASALRAQAAAGASPLFLLDLARRPANASKPSSGLRSQVATIERHLFDAQRRDADSLEALRRSYEERLSTLRGRARAASEANEQLQKENAETEAAVDGLRSEVAELVGSNRRLASELKEAHAAIDEAHLARQLSRREKILALPEIGPATSRGRRSGRRSVAALLQSGAAVVAETRSSDPGAAILSNMVRTVESLAESHAREVADVTDRFQKSLQEGQAELQGLQETWAALNATKAENDQSLADLTRARSRLLTAHDDLTARLQAIRLLVGAASGEAAEPSPSDEAAAPAAAAAFEPSGASAALLAAPSNESSDASLARPEANLSTLAN